MGLRLVSLVMNGVLLSTVAASYVFAQDTAARLDAQRALLAREDGQASGVSGDSKTSSSPAESAQDSESATTTLKGGVVKVELSLEKLRDLGLDLKHVLKAASSLYDEVTIQPVTLVTQPEVVGRGIIINIPVGTMPAGPRQPARKERVDLAMNNIRPIIGLLKKNADEFVEGHSELDLPDKVKEQLKPQVDQWVSLVNEAADRLGTLEELTKKPPYDNDSIATTVTDLQKDVQGLDKVRRSVYKVIRKEGKRIADAKSTAS